MRKTLLYVFCCVVAFLTLAPRVSAYEVVLKNGKVVKGDLVSQDDTMIVLKDATGIQVQLKKSTVDLQKTESANVPPAPPAAESKPAPASTAAPAQAKDQPKKPAKVYTQKDLDRLREEQDLGEGTFAEGAAEGSDETSDEAPAAKPEEKKSDEDAAKKAAEKQQKIEALQKRIAEIQQARDTLTKQCDYLKTLIFTKDRITDEKGNPLPFHDTIKKTCDDVDKATAALEQANQELNALQSQ